MITAAQRKALEAMRQGALVRGDSFWQIPAGDRVALITGKHLRVLKLARRVEQGMKLVITAAGLRALEQAIGAEVLEHDGLPPSPRQPREAVEHLQASDGEDVLQRRPFSEREIRVLHRDYPRMSTERIAQRLKRSLRSVYAKANDLGLKKTPEYLAKSVGRLQIGSTSGAEYRFKPGQIPFNKGLRRPPGWAPGRMRETQFKAGQVGNRFLPVGSRRVNADGYLEQKTSTNLSGPRNWVAVHRLVWIDAHGPIPAGHIVVFKRGMSTNVMDEITLDRLECVSRAENCRRNSMHRYPKEIVHLMQLRAAITRQINKRSKQERHHEEQD